MCIRDSLVTVLFVELVPRAGTSQEVDPEAMRDVVGGALVSIVAEVEDLGGKVTSCLLYTSRCV